MIEVQRLPLKRNLIDAVAIILSILIAFALEASWGLLQERQQEQAMLTDLAQEMRSNITDFELAHEQQVIRIKELDQIIREAGPDRLGLDAETLKTLLASIVGNPTFDMRSGVLNQFLRRGNLSLIESPELRNRLSGLEGFMSDYLANQMAPFYLVLDPTTLLNTGSIFFQSDVLYLPLPDAVLGASVPWGDPPTSEQVQALKALASIRGLTQVAVLRAPVIRNELSEILELIEDSR